MADRSRIHATKNTISTTKIGIQIVHGGMRIWITNNYLLAAKARASAVLNDDDEEADGLCKLPGIIRGNLKLWCENRGPLQSTYM